MITVSKSGRLFGQFKTVKKAFNAIKAAENLTEKSVVKYCYNDFFRAHFIKVNNNEYMLTGRI